MAPLGIAAPAPVEAQSAGAALYVSPAGNDVGPGSADAPWRTLSHALAALHAGDTLMVRGGTYRERVVGVTLQPGTAAQRITVEAAPGERPVVAGLLELDAPDYWTVSGINVTWDPATGKPDEHMVRILNGIGWVFENAELSGARSFAAILVGGTEKARPATWAVRDNCIHDTVPTNGKNQDQLVYVNSGLDAGAGVVERNILFGAHNGAGVKLAGPSSNSGGAARVTVQYNTVYDTAQSVLVGGASFDNVVRRNILLGVGRAEGVVRAFQLTGDGNVLSDNVAGGATRLQFSDTAYRALQDGGGNRFPVDPRFDSVTGCDGFHPRNAVAVAYGRHAAPAPAGRPAHRSSPPAVTWAAVAVGALAGLAVVLRLRRGRR